MSFGQPPQGGGLQPPPGQPQPAMGGPAGGPQAGASDAAEAVKLPSLLLMIFGGVSTVSSCLVSAGSLLNFLSTEDPGQIVATVSGFIGILINALIVFAGFKMKNLQMYPLAMAGAVFCCLPFCSGVCCVVGLVPGIFSVVVLMRPEVKAAFT